MKIRKGSCLILALCLAGAVAFAGVPPKTELTFSGAFVNPKAGPTSWRASGELLAPLGSGHLLVGPSVSILSDSELTEAGAVVEFNLAGKALGPFLRAAGSYLVKAPDVGDRESLSVGVGGKAPVGESGLFKFYIDRIVQGRGEGVADYAAAVALGVTF